MTARNQIKHTPHKVRTTIKGVARLGIIYDDRDAAGNWLSGGRILFQPEVPF